MTLRILLAIATVTSVTGCASARDAEPVDRPFFFQSIPPESKTPNNPTSWLTYPPEAAEISAPPAAPPPARLPAVAITTPAAAPSPAPAGPLSILPEQTVAAPPPAVAAVPVSDVQLLDWVVRGARRPAEGAAFALVSKTGAGAEARKVFEHQTDKDLGLVKEISRSEDGTWIVHTEVGWISQKVPAGSP